ncbi:MAG: FG-GAP-like repeat-containing protein [Gemmatimonadota bacterium]
MAAAALPIALLSACERASENPRERSAAILEARTSGLAALQQDRLDEAEAAFSRLVKLAPEQAAGYGNLALVNLRKGKLAEAEKWARRALERAPRDPDIRLVLARIEQVDGRTGEARRELEASLSSSPDHLRTLFVLAELAGRSRRPADRREARARLERVVELAPANPAARLRLVKLLLGEGEADAAAGHLETLLAQLPALPARDEKAFQRALGLARDGWPGAAAAALDAFVRDFRVTSVYQAGLQKLRGPDGIMVGFPILSFSNAFSLQVQEESAVLEALRFAEATRASGLDSAPASTRPAAAGQRAMALAVGDFDEDEDEDLFVAALAADGERSDQALLRSDLGSFIDVSASAGLGDGGRIRAAIFGDYDNDGRQDLFVVRAGPDRLYHNAGGGRFEDVTGASGITETADGHAALFVDLDHDGDLDLYVANEGPNALFRNNGDGTFSEKGGSMGVSGPESAESRDAAMADFDDDGDVDLVVVHADSPPSLYSNQRGGRFEEVGTARGLGARGAGPVGSAAVEVGDYDNDGGLDLVMVGGGRGRGGLYRNRGDGSFEPDRRSRALTRALAAARDVRFLDFDNDGHLDLILTGEPTGASRLGTALFHNDGSGGFEDTSSHLPREFPGGEALAVLDYNDDGDPDILVAGSDGRVHLLRNDGGNVGHYVDLRLVGLATGGGKNNRFGIGSRIEVRAGDLYQVRVVDRPRVHLGLGHRLKADVVRIEWTNGVAQSLFYPGTDQDLLEQRVLKGSCPFLYAWNGEGYRFVTDLMWKSALGMPLGILGGAPAGEPAAAGPSPGSTRPERRAYAPAGASREYVRIPAGGLAAREGVYPVRLTGELWETIFLDQVRLLAVDHPDSVRILSDERFVPPGPPRLQLYRIHDSRAPVSATDDRGRDVLPELRERDAVYVAGLIPGRYQGITRMHDLILDPGRLPEGQRVLLVLQGWIFPTDASINVAMAQSRRDRAVFPYLQVKDPVGRWRTVVDNLSVPSGKDKTIVVDLTDRFLSRDRRVRIRTNMEVYWDRAFFSVGDPPGLSLPGSPEEVAARFRAGRTSGAGSLRLAELRPTSADIHYRGFSRMYRKGGRYGPHWFDYEDVSTEPRWRDLVGSYTRYGDVLPLLERPDDMYVILNAGDEISVEFEAAQAPPPPPGWRRDFLLYTDGWIKDGDLNTATGQQVEPLPFHAQSRYPYEPPEAFPQDAAHRDWIRTYNTRTVRRPRF